MVKYVIRSTLFVLLVLFNFPFEASAELRLAQVFKDHMVLQREKPVSVWGWTDPGSSVSVSFAGQNPTTQANDKGYWRVTFDALAASTESRELKVSNGSQSVTLKDVLVGDVWLCAGQSNMARPLRNCSIDYPFFRKYTEDAEYPQVRFFDCSSDVSKVPLEDFDPLLQKDAVWKAVDKTTSLDVMSMAFFFSKELNKKLGVPVGLLQVAVSGTPLTAWMAPETFDALAAEFSDLPNYEAAFAAKDPDLAKASKGTFKNWEEFTAAEIAWKANPTGPKPGSDLSGILTDYPGVLYNSRIHPLAPMGIRGVLWHQGESGPGERHKERLMANIQQWRKLYGQDFFFIWGSLTRKTSSPPPMAPALTPDNVNEEFLLASQSFKPEDHAVLINFADLGNTATHWARMEEAGQRMARAAFASVYGKPETVFTGPELVEAKIEGAKVRAKFRHMGGGLVYEPSVDGISGFVIEGSGSALHWAEVAVEGDTIVLSHPDVSIPANVYYGWHNNPHETLFNKEGYPAYPFRAVPRARFAGKGSPGPFPLAQLVNPPAKMDLNLSHVRRNGYVFNAVLLKGTGSATVRAHLPKEWKGAVVTSQGKPVEAGALQTDANGIRFHEFTVEANGPWIIVANSENTPDFSAIDRF
jgi:sialate O-acetylesterase